VIVRGGDAEPIAARCKIVVEGLSAIAGFIPVAILTPPTYSGSEPSLERRNSAPCSRSQDREVSAGSRKLEAVYAPQVLPKDLVAGGDSLDVDRRRDVIQRDCMRIKDIYAAWANEPYFSHREPLQPVGCSR